MSAFDEYASWMKGWTDGAAARATRKEFLEHSNPQFRNIYLDGYDHGRNDRASRAKEAAERAGYEPNVLREVDP